MTKNIYDINLKIQKDKELFSFLLIDEIKLKRKREKIQDKIFNLIKYEENNIEDSIDFIKEKSGDSLSLSSSYLLNHNKKIKNIEDKLFKLKDKNFSLKIKELKKEHSIKIKNISLLIKKINSIEIVKDDIYKIINLLDKKKNKKFLTGIFIDFEISKISKKINKSLNFNKNFQGIKNIDDYISFYKNIQATYSEISLLKKNIIKSRQSISSLKKDHHEFYNLKKELNLLKNKPIKKELQILIINELYENKNLKKFMDNIDLNINYHFLVSNIKKTNEILDKIKNIDYQIHENENTLKQKKRKKIKNRLIV